MRVIKQNSPGDPLNQGTVVFHAGSNIAKRWEDFQEYSEADQDFFQQLLPLEEINFSDSNEIAVDPIPRSPNTVEVRSQSDVRLQEIPLLDDDEAMSALNTLRARGYSPEDIANAMTHLPVQTTKVNERRAARSRLDAKIKNETGKILRDNGINPQGKDFDKKRLNRTNFVVLKSTIDKKVNEMINKKPGHRDEFTKPELDLINEKFDEILEAAKSEVLSG